MSVARRPPRIPEILRFVVEAVLKYPVPKTESAVVDAYSNTEVEEAKSPHVPLLLNQNGVVVDCTVVPKLVSLVVKGQLIPLPEVRQTALTAKHPAARLIPPVL